VEKKLETDLHGNYINRLKMYLQMLFKERIYNNNRAMSSHPPRLLSKLEPRLCRNMSRQTEHVELTAYQQFIDGNQQHTQVYNDNLE
jgi:hypothetical protein